MCSTRPSRSSMPRKRASRSMGSCSSPVLARIMYGCGQAVVLGEPVDLSEVVLRDTERNMPSCQRAAHGA